MTINAVIEKRCDTRDQRFQRTTPALNFEADCDKSKNTFGEKSQIDISFPLGGKNLVTMKHDLITALQIFNKVHAINTSRFV
jgi:hypothetical protein